MHRALSSNQSPNRCNTGEVSGRPINTLGEIFRAYGEIYIREYRPCHQHIKLIRSMRICRTAGLVGHNYTCKRCGHSHYVYFGCGQSHCSICQSVKRAQWMDKMREELLAVPYVHLITTMPDGLNSLSRSYPRNLYNIIYQATNMTVNHFAKDSVYLGAQPGMISVLHTFGSDMKYHVHVHSLLTFGGISEEGKWKYPKSKKRLCKYKEFRNEYRLIFLELLQKEINQKKIHATAQQQRTIDELGKKSWSFYVTKPTLATGSIELYLARYINRIAVTNSRIRYLKETEKVRLLYNDYKNQKEGQAAPKEIKMMDPLVFMNQYLQHEVPPYFHKTRRYGLHSSATKKKHEQVISEELKRNGQTIRTVMEIITQLLKEPVMACEHCRHTEFEIEVVSAERRFIHSYLSLENINNRSP